jgi:hypothetical protein
MENNKKQKNGGSMKYIVIAEPKNTGEPTYLDTANHNNQIASFTDVQEAVEYANQKTFERSIPHIVMASIYTILPPDKDSGSTETKNTMVRNTPGADEIAVKMKNEIDNLMAKLLNKPSENTEA